MDLQSLKKSDVNIYYEQNESDENWRLFIRNASDWCFDHMDKNLERYQKMVKVSKEECDAKFTYYFSCVTIYTSMVSFANILQKFYF